MTDKDKAPETKQPAEKQPAQPSAPPDADAARPASEPAQEAEPDDPFDFGGLPNRNLKKNLGCG
jgi:hypothetical protein